MPKALDKLRLTAPIRPFAAFNSLEKGHKSHTIQTTTDTRHRAEQIETVRSGSSLGISDMPLLDAGASRKIMQAAPPAIPGLNQDLHPGRDRAACGIGLAATKSGKQYPLVRDLLQRQLEEGLGHRGGCGIDGTGHGAGALFDISKPFFTRVARELLSNAGLPSDQIKGENLGIAMLFLPRAKGDGNDHEIFSIRRKAYAIIENALFDFGLGHIGRRKVPVNSEVLPPTALLTRPSIRQILFERPEGLSDQEFEQRAYECRKAIEYAFSKINCGNNTSPYLVSMSTEFVIYKGMLNAKELFPFYCDLRSPHFGVSKGEVHTRFSTNTTPSWERAQPCPDGVAHNGEINTIVANQQYVAGLERALERAGVSKAQARIIRPGETDSARFGRFFGWLTHHGVSTVRATYRMIQPAWENRDLDHEQRSSNEKNSAVGGPWDGPAHMLFCSGKKIGAMLDRNGLRPSHYTVLRIGPTEDEKILVVASEKLDFLPKDKIIDDGSLRPGQRIILDSAEHRILKNNEVEKIFVKEAKEQLAGIEVVAFSKLDSSAVTSKPASVMPLVMMQRAVGLKEDHVRKVILPMAETGKEALGSMGNDTPIAVFREKPLPLNFFMSQLFAQVTNPPQDSIRERDNFSLYTYLGPHGDHLILGEVLQRRVLRLDSPVLSFDDMAKLEGNKICPAGRVDALFSADAGEGALKRALTEMCEKADKLIDQGKSVIILSDRKMGEIHAPIPMLLAVGALNEHLKATGLLGKVSLVVESGEIFEPHGLALAIAYGAAAVHPYLALETVSHSQESSSLKVLENEELSQPESAKDQPKPVTIREMQQHYLKAMGDGLLKIMSKMGITTVQGYMGSQNFVALGFGDEVIKRAMSATASPVGGLSLQDIQEMYLQMHRDAVTILNTRLDTVGEYSEKPRGVPRLHKRKVWELLQEAVHGHVLNQRLEELLQKEYGVSLKNASRTVLEEAKSKLAEEASESYRNFVETVEDHHPTTFRNFMQILDGSGKPIPKRPFHREIPRNIESRRSIISRFKGGAMSYGALSKQTHEDVAFGLNKVGGRSNTGEGGEDSRRYHDKKRNSAIKQIASARFGVTAALLRSAKELEIKMAQGAKPGEGGQLPGEKVYPDIAAVRKAPAGVGLISPPPHHDIYSIEDLGQLIDDLKNVNPDAQNGVKLVASVGIGTIAAGVVAARADRIVTAGHSGGTGAAPLSSLYHAGLPGEIGVAEVHQTLLGIVHPITGKPLRHYVRVQVDGGLMTGRDVVKYSLLGADDFAFATADLIALGCKLLRRCHQNTCGKGLTTHDPKYLAMYTGSPDDIVRYKTFLADEVREILADMDQNSLDQIIGRAGEFLRIEIPPEYPRARKTDFTWMLYDQMPGYKKGRGNTERRNTLHRSDHELDQRILRDASRVIRKKSGNVSLQYPISNRNRSVMTYVSGELVKRHGEKGLPEGSVNITFNGVAGLSACAFLPPGFNVTLVGGANDYLAKGMSGSTVAVVPSPETPDSVPQDALVGNVVGYGATGGNVVVRGGAGERFLVRGSGINGVAEAVGDHAFEYMTMGSGLVLGKNPSTKADTEEILNYVGQNMAAGASGGERWVYVPKPYEKEFCKRVSHDSVVPRRISNAQKYYVPTETNWRKYYSTNTKPAENVQDLSACKTVKRQAQSDAQDATAYPVPGYFYRPHETLREGDYVQQISEPEYVRQLIELHYKKTGSPRAKELLDNWDFEQGNFMALDSVETLKVLAKPIDKGGRPLQSFRVLEEAPVQPAATGNLWRLESVRERLEERRRISSGVRERVGGIPYYRKVENRGKLRAR